MVGVKLGMPRATDCSQCLTNQNPYNLLIIDRKSQSCHGHPILCPVFGWLHPLEMSVVRTAKGHCNVVLQTAL